MNCHNTDSELAALAYTFVNVFEGCTDSSVPMSYGSLVGHKSLIKDEDVMLSLEERSSNDILH